MIARYFDSVWPEYERRVVVDASGAVTGETLQRRRRFSYFTVTNSSDHFINLIIIFFV